MDIDDTYSVSDLTGFWSRHANEITRRTINSTAISLSEPETKLAKNLVSSIWDKSNQSFESFSFDGGHSENKDESESGVESKDLKDSGDSTLLLRVYPDCMYFFGMLLFLFM